jgi:hypothetical protein
MGGRFAGFEVVRFSRIGLAFGFFLPRFAFMDLMWQRVANTSKTYLLSDQSR